MLYDRLACRLDGGLGFGLAPLATRGRLAHVGQLMPGGFGRATAAVEFLRQGGVSNGPGLELRPRLLLLLTQELPPPFQLPQLSVRRGGLSLGIVASLEARDPIRLERRLRFAGGLFA